jgi:hypothetical protein
VSGRPLATLIASLCAPRCGYVVTVSLKQLATCGSTIIGAGDRTRTGKDFSGGFSSHYIFRCQPEVVRALDYAFTVVLSHFRYPPSSLYTFLDTIRLRSALPRPSGQGVLRI